MEKNYRTMETEVEKLRAELTNNANNDRRTGIFILIAYLLLSELLFVQTCCKFWMGTYIIYMQVDLMVALGTMRMRFLHIILLDKTHT